MCVSRLQCVVSIAPARVDFEGIIVGDDMTKSFVVTNAGALGTSFKIQDITYGPIYVFLPPYPFFVLIHWVIGEGGLFEK